MRSCWKRRLVDPRSQGCRTANVQGSGREIPRYHSEQQNHFRQNRELAASLYQKAAKGCHTKNCSNKRQTTQADKGENNRYEYRTEIHLRATRPLTRKGPHDHGSHGLCHVHCERDCRDRAIHRTIGAAFVRRWQHVTIAPGASDVTTCRGSSLECEILRGSGARSGQTWRAAPKPFKE
jgi:hypothetical protein